MSSSDVPDSVARNIALWTQTNEEYTDSAAAEAWSKDEITFGMLGVPNSELSVIGDVAGVDVVELGCGTAYFSAWLAKAGARPVGVDPTPAQLATARRMQERTGIEFPLVEAPGEQVPLPDESFDLAVSEYGASLWADPERWVAEAARLLRARGRLVFLTNSPLAILCSPEREEEPIQERLLRPQFGMYRVEWPDDVGVEYHLSHSDWIRLLHANGFQVEELWELQAPEGWRPHSYYGWLTTEWARRWPAEEIWAARKRG